METSGPESFLMTTPPWIGPGDGPEQEFSTGDAEDDELLRQIARQSSLDAARDWVHFLDCQDEVVARSAAAEIAAAGWSVQVDLNDEGEDWCVAAEQFGVITSADVVRQARTFFESVAARHAGACYDGWQASV
jgi:hypothetical protein